MAFGGSGAAGAGAIWVPMGDGGVAVIDPDTLAVTVIPVDAIGHRVEGVAFDGDVVYVASRNQVTSIVDGEVRATTSTGEIRYLGHVDGVFGVEHRGAVHRPQGDRSDGGRDRQISATGANREIDGEAWAETGRNYNLRRAELLAGLSTTTLPAPTTQTSTTQRRLRCRPGLGQRQPRAIWFTRWLPEWVGS